MVVDAPFQPGGPPRRATRRARARGGAAGEASGPSRADMVAMMDVLLRPPDSALRDADTVAVGLFEGEGTPADAPPAVAELVASGEARANRGSVALAHADGRRWLLVGLGARAQLAPEPIRVAAAGALRRAREASARELCWLLPEGGDGATAAALVEGTVLADYRFERYKSTEPPEEDRRLERLVVAGPDDLEGAVGDAAVIAARVNRTRDLQNRPGNDLTPTVLGDYARALADELPELSVEVEGREGIAARGMGAFSAVAQGSAQPPALITMTYAPPSAAKSPVLAFVGKAVTFDSGGISLKPGAKMSEMKFDMSGGAAAIEATAAIAALGLPIRLLTVVGATENLPSSAAVKPGDIVTAANGRTIEINNTDAEGRLVLADCLCHAVAEGAERIVDLATLTGAVIVALGNTYAGLMANDEELAARVTAAGERSGEIVWRLPLHEEYDELIKGKYADLDNAPEARKAGTIVGGAFLSHFVGETPWAHLDIAGSAWELGRAYVGKGASGYGVRLLVELARDLAV
jgi:leucyl aminopeptidase